MTTETTFEARPYGGEEDLPAICDLLNTCLTTDKLLGEPYVTVESMGQMLDEPGLDNALDVRLWMDRAGRVIGYGETHIEPSDEEQVVDAHLFFRVHPATRDVGLEREIVGWAEERVRAVARERGQKAHLRAGLHLTTPEYIAYRQGALEALGFRPVRYGYKMARPLNEPMPEPQFAPGYTLRRLEKHEHDKWVDTFNWSFIDHWNHHPLTPEQHEHWVNNPNHQDDGDLIAVAEDGTIAAFCRCEIIGEDNAKMGRNEGWIDALGTRRGHRKIGLGRAMLLAGMLWLKSQAIETAVLNVDAENPTGALRLYESVGFEVTDRTATYHKDL
ncbi:MAG: GNAT family N-acetyltransferase [Chloroflexia bacterium]